MTLLLISFLAGALTVLAPCILPLLPVVIGRSVAQGTRNTPLIVTISLGVSILVFTLALKASTALISIPQDFWKYLSGGILIAFGIFTLFEIIWVRIVSKFKLQEKANAQFAVGYKKKSIWGDVIMGAALGPVFSTCSPTYFIILATVLPESYAKGIVYILVYILGLSLVLFGIAKLGQRFTSKLEVLANPNGWFKRMIAILFILIGLAIVTGFDKKIEARILDAGFFDVTKIEQNLLQTNDSSTNNATNKTNIGSDITSLLYATGVAAPDISTPDGFINTNGKNISLEQYKGKKVVLLDYWTYSCINCKRTIPYLNALYEKYREYGLEIIGLHTPEFAFERLQTNVEKSVREFGIQYPVVLDNDFSTWRAYGNQYWPRKYIIDTNGNIVYDHIGEGAYEETEAVIKYLLIKNGLYTEDVRKNESSTSIFEKENDFVSIKMTPEIYFGSDRNEYFGNGVSGKRSTQVFVKKDSIKKDFFYLEGTWEITPEYIELISNTGSISIAYTAKTINLVSSVTKDTTGIIRQDNEQPFPLTLSGDGLINLKENTTPESHTITTSFSKKKDETIRLYTFTFSS